MDELHYIYDQLCNNPCCLYNFYARYFWWIWEGTNVCDFFGRELNTGAAILKLFLIAPFIGVTILFPVWLYGYALAWCGEVYAGYARLPKGLRLKDALRGIRASDHGEVELKSVKVPKDQPEMYGGSFWKRLCFWDRKNWRFPLRDKKGNIVYGKDGKPIIRDGVRYCNQRAGCFLKDGLGRYVLDDDGDPIFVDHMFYHVPGDLKCFFREKPGYSKFMSYVHSPMCSDDDE